MSKGNPQQPGFKQSFLQTMLIFAVLYTGTLLLFPQCFNPAAREARPLEEVRQEMVTMNAELKDQSILKLQSVHDRAVEAKAKEEDWDEARVLREKMAAAVLIADTQYKAGTLREEIKRLDAAYRVLFTYHRYHKNDEAWTTVTYPVASREGFERDQVTPKQLYQDVSTELDQLYRDDLILGLIPGYAFIDFLVGLTGHQPNFSYAFAALLLAIAVRGIVWPLAQKQYMWSRQMGQLSPLMKEIQDSYKDKLEKNKANPKRLQELRLEQQQATMKLYSEYGINPAAGCLPMFLQLPLFLLVYQCMVHYRFAFAEGNFLWINPSTSAANDFFAPSLGDMDTILLIIYGVSMVVTSLLTPITATDPQQIRTQRIMGLTIGPMITVFMFFWPLPSAFVLYWIFTNVLTTFQALRSYRLPLPPLQKVATAEGGLLPLNGLGQKNGKQSIETGEMFGKTNAPRQHKPKPKRRK